MHTQPDRFRRVDAVFDAALDLPAADQTAFIDRACGDDAALREEVNRLLHAYRRSGSFLESPAAEIGAPLVEHAHALATAALAERIGPFRVVREIGQGGMGRVFLGERADGQFEQRVALKLIQHGAPGLIRHFLEERRILALLEHPNIARLIDGGITADGLPFFAMELVEGEPIDRYCETHGLSLHQRLDLFAEVCDAVTYAHQQLVIHRDLKPSNILVTPEGRIKLLDFGIAKLIVPRDVVGDPTSVQLHAMTPEFAAPEQVRGEPVSTATDVYALGVLLYILLTGERPYDLRGKSPAELERIICEIDPPRPSSRAKGQFGPKLRGDLDSIVMKALHKEKERRYQSPAAIAQDLTRYRAGHPIEARPDSRRYRLGKFIVRHRIGVAASAAFVMLSAAYVVKAAIDRNRIERALREATLGTYKAEQTTDFMLGLFEASETGETMTDTVRAREMLGRGVERAREMKAQPELQAQMLDVIGRLYSHVGEYKRAQPLLEEALTMRKKLYGSTHVDVATTLLSLAQAKREQGDGDGAARLDREALAIRRQLLGPNHVKTADALFNLAADLHVSGDYKGAEPLMDEWTTIVAAQPTEITKVRADQLASLAYVYWISRDYQKAEQLFRETLSINRKLFGERHDRVAVSLSQVGEAVCGAGRHEEAERLIRQSVEMLGDAHPDGHPTLAFNLKMLGIELDHLNRFADAALPLREALAQAQRFEGSRSNLTTDTQLELAYALTMSGNYDEAVSVSREAMAMLRKKFADTTAMVARAKLRLGDALRGQGKLMEAERLLLTAHATFTKRSTRNSWTRGSTRALIRLYEAQGRRDEAARYAALLDSSTAPRPVAQPPH